MFGFIFSLLIGALAGYIAGRIMGSETSTVRNIVPVSYTHLPIFSLGMPVSCRRRASSCARTPLVLSRMERSSSTSAW